MVSKEQKNIVIAIAAIIGIIIFALILSFGINTSGVKKLEKDAEAYMEKEDYKSAEGIYSRLISKTGKEKFKEKRENARLLNTEFNHYSNGIKKLENSEYISAIKYFTRIERKDSLYYEKSKKEVAKIEKEVIKKAEEAISDDNSYLASSVLSDYLESVGKSEKVEKLLKTLKDQDIAQVDEDGEEKDKDSKNKKDLKTEALPSNTKDWVGKTVEIQSGKANIRDGASLEGKVIGIAVEGDALKIEKIHDDGGRVWCYGSITSAKTGKTQTGWISSKNL